MLFPLAGLLNVWLELKRLDFESWNCLNRTCSCDVHERIKAILAICQDGKPLWPLCLLTSWAIWKYVDSICCFQWFVFDLFVWLQVSSFDTHTHLCYMICDIWYVYLYIYRLNIKEKTVGCVSFKKYLVSKTCKNNDKHGGTVGTKILHQLRLVVLSHHLRLVYTSQVVILTQGRRQKSCGMHGMEMS